MISLFAAAFAALIRSMSWIFLMYGFVVAASQVLLGSAAVASCGVDSRIGDDPWGSIRACDSSASSQFSVRLFENLLNFS
jgi:hypothetical protein